MGDMMPTKDEANPKGRILVVDDEPFTLDLVKLTLATARFHVETAASGEDALLLLEQATYDLMLLDVMMPVISGFDVMRQQQSNAASMPPVIILSAMGTSDAKQTAEELGAIGYLVKPIARGALLDAVNAALGISTDENPPH